jgi:hypothetical protein
MGDVDCMNEATHDAHTLIRWDFDRFRDTTGWTVPAAIYGEVTGSALWLKLESENNETTYRQHIWPGEINELTSPKGLQIPAKNVKSLKMRIMNLSPETDGLVFWRTVEELDKDQRSASFVMKPYHHDWQEVICSLDEHQWDGNLDHLRIRVGLLGSYGDIWIDSISLCSDSHKVIRTRPDIKSQEVVPQIQLPGISQADFQMAFDVLDECLVSDVPASGFKYPFQGPGGAYGPYWWQLDTSLNLAGTKWVNQQFAENVIRGFIGVQAQNPDGRIDLYGGAPIRGRVADTSSIPRYFEAAYEVVCRTTDLTLIREIYHSLDRYMDWWLSPIKRDQHTGLIMAHFEETFGVGEFEPQIIAAVDLNVAIALGANYTAKIAERLQDINSQKKHEATFAEIYKAINLHLWDDELGYYCAYLVKERETLPNLGCTTFDTFRLQIAPPERIAKLLPLLLDPDLFNWGTVPVTSVAKTDPTYVEAVGPYDGRAWFGDIWTMRNIPIIAGLEDIGRHDLAAELTWRTILIFNRNYCEFLEPSKGEGHGVERYGWSASQYIQAIIEHLFGIKFDAESNTLRIFPNIPKALEGQQLSIKNVLLPTAALNRLSLTVEKSEGTLSLQISVEGDIGDGTLHIAQPNRHTDRKPEIIAVDGSNSAQILDISDDKSFCISVSMQKSVSIELRL